MSVLPLGITDSDFCSSGISLLLDTNRTTVQVTFLGNSKDFIRKFEILDIAMYRVRNSNLSADKPAQKFPKIQNLAKKTYLGNSLNLFR